MSCVRSRCSCAFSARSSARSASKRCAACPEAPLLARQAAPGVLLGLDRALQRLQLLRLPRLPHPAYVRTRHRPVKILAAGSMGQ